MTTKTTYKVGDKVRIMDAKGICAGFDLDNGKEYPISKIDSDGDIYVIDGANDELLIAENELKYIEKVAEQVAKFKVGDKVEVVSKSESGYGKGVLTVTEGKRGDMSGGNYTLDGKYIVLGDNIKHAPSKPTKNQRISALEQTVADLQAEVEALKAAQKIAIKGPTMTVKADVDVAKVAESLAKAIEKHSPKSPNEQRKAIIAEAKAFLIEVEREQNDSKVRGKGNAIHRQYLTKTEFIVNADKRTVVAIIRSKFGATVLSKAIAKCAPDDVFNADIGKAIALGRALGLDVERFEKAVQPSEVVAGMDVSNTWCGKNNILSVTKVEGNKVWRTNGMYIEMKYAKITDDTKAQY